MQHQCMNEDFLDRLFNTNVHEMKTDILEEEKGYVFMIEVPGMSNDQIKLHVEDGYLVVETNNKECECNKKERYIRRERTFGKFQRRFYVGNFDEKDIKATLKCGLLSVCVPRTNKENKRFIEVQNIES